MVKAILFDFMGVLLFKKSAYQAEELVDKVDNEIGHITDDKVFKQKLINEYNLSSQQIDELLDKIINKYERFQTLWDLLPELRTRYKLAIINNGTALTLKKLKELHNIDDNFDLFVSSAIEGIAKPDSRLFLLTCKRLKVEPSECLFMDDSFKNIQGAEKLGMKVIWWENKEIGFDKFKDFLNSNRRQNVLIP